MLLSLKEETILMASVNISLALHSKLIYGYDLTLKHILKYISIEIIPKQSSHVLCEQF